MTTTPSSPKPTTDDDPREVFSLAALTRAAGVSTRTVRYYIAEGLLPPPVNAGPRASYTTAHLNRLRLIGQLKEAFLPLREIRRRLTGLSDDEVAELIESDVARPAATPKPTDSAASYIGRVLASQRSSAGRSVRSRPAAPGGAHRGPGARPGFTLPQAMRAELGRSQPEAPKPTDPVPPPLLGRAYPAQVLPILQETMPDADEATDDAAATSEQWRRVPLGDDAELLVRESVYQRRRDRVDWLVAWAKKVFH